MSDSAYHIVKRGIIGGALLLSLVAMGVAVAHATEIIPSLGVTKAVKDDGADAKLYGGLAFRSQLLPLIQGEIGIAYREEDRSGDLLKLRMWPVTASAWLRPIPSLYAGGGAGWYYTTYDYASSTPFKDTTKQQFGVHLGGGLAIPLTPMVGLDLNGRYIFMKKQHSELPPESFNPDFWTTSLGLAFKF